MSRLGETPRLFTREQCEAISRKTLSFFTLPHGTVSLRSDVGAITKFARGDTYAATENIQHGIQVSVTDQTGRTGIGGTTDFTEAGLRAAVKDAEAAAAEHTPWLTLQQVLDRMPAPTPAPESPKVYFDDLFAAASPEARAGVFRAAVGAAEAGNLVTAGTMNFELFARSTMNTKGFFHYDRMTYGEFSLTARTKDGTGSGWAWGGYEDWNRVPVAQLIARAVDLGKRSAHPVAVEPGRYTVILEPAAVAALLGLIVRPWYLMMQSADRGLTAYGRDPIGNNKIGLQMMDSRLALTADPWDPEMPMPNFEGGTTIGKVSWFDGGVLKHLYADNAYAASRGQEVVNSAQGFRLQPNMPVQSLDEMIASTKRGVWVNRLTSVDMVNGKTALLTGMTRDGTFLIENGKITKAIKNFRFNESPFFILNKLEAVGTPVRASRGMVTPRLKVRDFDFTSLSDAV